MQLVGPDHFFQAHQLVTPSAREMAVSILPHRTLPARRLPKSQVFSDARQQKSLFLPGEFFLALLYFLVAGYPINCPTENSSMPLLKASCFVFSGRRIMVYLLSCIPGQLMFFWCKEVVAILGKQKKSPSVSFTQAGQNPSNWRKIFCAQQIQEVQYMVVLCQRSWSTIFMASLYSYTKTQKLYIYMYMYILFFPPRNVDATQRTGFCRYLEPYNKIL